MTQPVSKLPREKARIKKWMKRVAELMDQLATWSKAEGWKIERLQFPVEEDGLGQHEVPALRVHALGGELLATPIALHTIGGDGRVDLEAFPTLSRVKLLTMPDGWRIMTDSNVPLRLPWNKATFVQLANDLLS